MSKAIIKTIKDNNYNIVAMRLWVFGYPEALETLFTLPGWPDAMRSDSLNTKDGRWNKMPIEALWSRDVASELTVTDVCEALNILRQHNCGYFALFNQEAARAGDTSCTVMAWLASPGAPPMVAGPYHEKWPQLVKQLIQAQWSSLLQTPDEFLTPTDLTKVERAFVEHRAYGESLKKFDNILGG